MTKATESLAAVVVVTMLAFHTNDASLNPTEMYMKYEIMFEKNEKEAGDEPFEKFNCNGPFWLCCQSAATDSTNLRGGIMIQLTSCYFCLDSAALLKLHKQPFYAQTEGQSRTVILPPMLRVLWLQPSTDSCVSAEIKRKFHLCIDTVQCKYAANSD